MLSQLRIADFPPSRQELPNSFRLSLEPPNVLRPNLEQPISFCNRLEPKLSSSLHPNLEPLSSLRLIELCSSQNRAVDLLQSRPRDAVLL